MSNYRTDVVGSLLRPSYLKEARCPQYGFASTLEGNLLTEAD